MSIYSLSTASGGSEGRDCLSSIRAGCGTIWRGAHHRPFGCDYLYFDDAQRHCGILELKPKQTLRRILEDALGIVVVFICSGDSDVASRWFHQRLMLTADIFLMSYCCLPGGKKSEYTGGKVGIRSSKPGAHHQHEYPPSTTRLLPVTKLLASEARKTTAGAISCGAAIRRIAPR